MSLRANLLTDYRTHCCLPISGRTLILPTLAIIATYDSLLALTSALVDYRLELLNNREIQESLGNEAFAEILENRDNWQAAEMLVSAALVDEAAPLRIALYKWIKGMSSLEHILAGTCLGFPLIEPD